VGVEGATKTGAAVSATEAPAAEGAGARFPANFGIAGGVSSVSRNSPRPTEYGREVSDDVNKLRSRVSILRDRFGNARAKAWIKATRGARKPKGSAISRTAKNSSGADEPKAVVKSAQDNSTASTRASTGGWSFFCTSGSRVRRKGRS
jgi:hypothetical protein